MEIYEADPWGTWRDNAHAGLIASVMANAFRNPNASTLTFNDFMFVDKETAEKARQERQRQMNQQLIDTLTAMSVKHG